MGNRIVHFEIPAIDVEKLSKFYSDLFDWKFTKQSMQGMDYWTIETTGTGMEHLSGGMYVKQRETDRPRFYVAVDDLDARTDKLKQAGGTVIIEKEEIPGQGWSVIATDPESNMIALFQPTHQQAQAQLKKAPARKKVKPTKKKSRKK